MSISAVDLYILEKNASKKAVQSLRTSLKAQVRRTTKQRTGTAIKDASARAVFRKQSLQRIVLTSQGYVFKQNYGFEGSKKNGVNMRLKATRSIEQAVVDSGIIDSLATDIANIRAEQVVLAINFLKDGR